MSLLNFNKTVPYIRKKGILGYFQIIYHNFFDLVLLNFLFFITSLPIITIGASYKALICVCNKYSDDEVVYPVREFFKEFKQNFFKSFAFGLIFNITFVIIAFSCLFYFNLSKENIIFSFFSLISAVCLFLLLMIVCWFFPLYTKCKQNFKTLIINSFILSFTFIKSSFCYILVLFLLFLLHFFLFPYSVPFIAILPFSLIALSSSCATTEKINETFSLKTENVEE
ncbi:MAG: YesL family protein [Clostridia bacterium]|nr:YesL family protein [Clostridia bacterium]